MRSLRKERRIPKTNTILPKSKSELPRKKKGKAVVVISPFSVDSGLERPLAVGNKLYEIGVFRFMVVEKLYMCVLTRSVSIVKIAVLAFGLADWIQ